MSKKKNLPKNQGSFSLFYVWKFCYNFKTIKPNLKNIKPKEFLVPQKKKKKSQS